MITRRTFCSAAASLGLLGTSNAQAAPLAKPDGAIILTISGRIGVTNAGDTAVFDRAMLEALGMISFRTHTPWYSEPTTFEGVPMTVLMQCVEAKGQTLTTTALSDYCAETPIADLARYHPILALKRDGQYLEIRDKGPLFLVYPFDSAAELQSQRFYSQSTWQIVAMSIE
jgi:hypothetical protein